MLPQRTEVYALVVLLALIVATAVLSGIQVAVPGWFQTLGIALASGAFGLAMPKASTSSTPQWDATSQSVTYAPNQRPSGGARMGA